MTSQINKNTMSCLWFDVGRMLFSNVPFVFEVGFLNPQSSKMKTGNQPSSNIFESQILNTFQICCAHACLRIEVATSRHPNIQFAQTLTRHDTVFCILQKHPWKQIICLKHCSYNIWRNAAHPLYVLVARQFGMS